ncbi:hypothetical protein UFOVP169_23 [uncultured Caudovirales phage]|uniref:Uncharacterized protein n=1 Tax=uncultured Caudovirales phage TaxID=2100421 RepID=A0A6J7WF01_9CAUD|nr:hypothetical protein UFOVP169_23 [uncultured Caudovirales phage]
MNYELVDKTTFIVYRLNGLTYLPHYQKINCYVRPGYGRWNYAEYNAAQLVNAGAITSTEYLMNRFGGAHGKA